LEGGVTTEKRVHRSEQKREQILTAAKRLFLQHGFAYTSTDAIKAEAGISKETLYRYYASKEELFADVLRQLTLEHLPKQLPIDKTLPELRSREALHAALLVLAQEVASVMMQPEYLALLRVILAETPRFPHLGELFRSTVPEQSIAYVVSLLMQMRDQDLIADINYEAAARMFLGSLLTYAVLDGLLATDGAPHPPGADQIAALVDVFLRMIT